MAADLNKNEDLQRLFLLEMLVDSVKFNNDKITLGKTLLDSLKQTCVRFQFMNFPVIEVCEEDFCKNDYDYDVSDVIFKSGKSCFFSLSSLPPNIRYPKIGVTVVRAKDDPPPVVIGTCCIALDKGFLDLLTDPNCAGDSCEACKTLKDVFPIFDKNGIVIGCITLFIRLSCFGKAIITQFKMPEESHSGYLFKNNNVPLEAGKMYAKNSKATCPEFSKTGQTGSSGQTDGKGVGYAPGSSGANAPSGQNPCPPGGGFSSAPSGTSPGPSPMPPGMAPGGSSGIPPNFPGNVPGMSPCPPSMVPGGSSAMPPNFPGSFPGMTPGTVPAGTPGMPQAPPWSAPGSSPGTFPSPGGMGPSGSSGMSPCPPGMFPAGTPGMPQGPPWSAPGSSPGTFPSPGGMTPGGFPGMSPCPPGTVPAGTPGMSQGPPWAAPGSSPGTFPSPGGMTPGGFPGMSPCPPGTVPARSPGMAQGPPWAAPGTSPGMFPSPGGMTPGMFPSPWSNTPSGPPGMFQGFPGMNPCPPGMVPAQGLPSGAMPPGQGAVNPRNFNQWAGHMPTINRAEIGPVALPFSTSDPLLELRKKAQIDRQISKSYKELSISINGKEFTIHVLRKSRKKREKTPEIQFCGRLPTKESSDSEESTEDEVNSCTEEEVEKSEQGKDVENQINISEPGIKKTDDSERKKVVPALEPPTKLVPQRPQNTPFTLCECDIVLPKGFHFPESDLSKNQSPVVAPGETQKPTQPKPTPQEPKKESQLKIPPILNTPVSQDFTHPVSNPSSTRSMKKKKGTKSSKVKKGPETYCLQPNCPMGFPWPPNIPLEKKIIKEPCCPPMIMNPGSVGLNGSQVILQIADAFVMSRRNNSGMCAPQEGDGPTLKMGAANLAKCKTTKLIVEFPVHKPKPRIFNVKDNDTQYVDTDVNGAGDDKDKMGKKSRKTKKSKKSRKTRKTEAGKSKKGKSKKGKKK